MHEAKKMFHLSLKGESSLHLRPYGILATTRMPMGKRSLKCVQCNQINSSLHMEQMSGPVNPVSQSGFSKLFGKDI